MAKKRTLERAITGLLVVALALAMLPLGGVPLHAATGDPVLVNEVLASHTGTDDTEYVELYGTPGTSLDGLSLIVVEGDVGIEGTIDRRLDFGAADALGANGFYLVGNPVGLGVNYGVVPNVDIGNDYFENSSLTVALVETSSIGGGSITGGEVVLDAVALNDGGEGDVFFFGAPVIGPDGEYFPAGVRRVSDGVDTDTVADWVMSDFNLGSDNTPTAGDAPPPDYTPIYDIQFTTDPSGDSPYDDEVVTTEGVVTAAFSSGYYIEDPAGGAWNGLWVYDTTNTPARGDAVRLTGTVDEYYNLTELKDVSEYAVLSTGNALPEPVVVTTGAANDEQYESVLIRVESVQVIAGEDAYYEWVVDDGSGPLVVDNLGTDTYLPVVGEELAAIVGPLNFSYGAFKIAPRDDDDIVMPGPDYTPIYDIQYTTDPGGDSPYDDEVVTTEGVVIAAFSSGYFVEDPAGGAWNGLWVYDTTNTPARGDAVRLTGTVDEYYNLTELKDVSEYAVLSTGNALPEPVVVTTGAANDEQYESVLIRVESVQVIAGEDAYYEWVVDDGSGPLVVDNLGTDTYLPVVGEELAAIVGPLNFSYGAFKIAPRDDDDIIFSAPPPPFIINEVDSDTPSYDELEFIELYDGGAGNSALDGLVVVLFNGSDDASYMAFDLDGYVTDPGGYLVIGSVDGADIYVDPGAYGWLQNGADAVALYSGDAADFPNDTAVTTEGLLDALVYDTNDGDDSGLLVLLNEGQAQINEDGSGDKDNESNQRCPNGEGGARNTGTYTQFVPTPGAANCELPPPPFIINEVDSDTPGYDELEFIELYDGGAGNMALDGLVVVLFNGSDDASYEPAFDLDGYTTDADGYFVIGSVDGADIYVDPGAYGWLQNGADAVALYSGDAVDFPNDTAVTTEGLLDALVYDTNDGDDSGLLVLLNEGQAQINEDGSGDKDNQSNQRCPNGEGGARNTDTYTQSAPTPGWANCEPPPEQCGDDYTYIYTIQGDGLASELDGAVVSTEGIVVGDFQDGKSGYFIQDVEGDGFDDTSDGIFVYGTSPDVNVGDHVRVRGTVDEYYELTEITSVSQVWVCSTGNELPAPAELSLPVEDIDDFEPFEGMLVTFPQALVISEYYNFDRYGEIVLTSERQNTPTAVVEPGEDAIALAAENALDRITLDDGRGSQNPDPAIHPNGEEFTLDNLFRGGDLVSNVTGALDYNYGLYRIQPTQGADYAAANERSENPDSVGDSNVKVASFNVLNYFTTIDTGDWICGPSEDMECRGADTTEEYERQRDKIVSALVAMDADVVGLIEIENHPEDVPTADLVYWLNEALGATTYHYIETGAIGTDAIRQAFIYKPATVTPVGGYAVLDSTVDARFLDDYNRPALAQTFMDNATGGNFTVAVNHLKSKGSSCAAIGDPDTGDGSGNCNLTRTAAAEALVDWLASDPTGSGDDDYLIIGDLNSYDKEDPIDVLLAGGYTDLVYEYLGEYAYSYVFDGAVGYLDHGLANGALVDRVTGATIWHINADEPDLIDYDMSYKLDAQDAIYAPDAYRSSDHDPVIVGLCTDETAPTVEIRLNRDTLWPPRHQYVTVHATVHVDDNFDDDPVVELVSVTSSQPDDGLGDGDTADDIVILNDFTFKLRAERMGGDEDRIYTIIYTVTDDCGNVTIATATVTVPHDMGR